MALLGHVSAVKLSKESMYDPEYYAGLYTNVLLDVSSLKHHNDKVRNKDAYDLDPETVSPYDSMDQHKPWTNEQRKDWFKKKSEHDEHKYKIFDDAQISSENLVQRTKKDAYDYDGTSASPYDAASNINGGNVVGIKSSYTDNDTPIGPKEKDLVAAIKKGYWWDKELEKELARPAGAGQADARAGFGGAIPYGKDGKINCDAVGATCDAPVVEQKAAEDKKADEAEEKADAETKKEAEKIIADEKEKAAKKEKGEGPETEAEPTKAAFAQLHHYKY